MTDKEGRAAAEAHRRRARALRDEGRAAEAERAELDALAASSGDPELLEAGRALLRSRTEEAEALLRPYLERYPDDAVAVRMLASAAGIVGRHDEAEALMRRTLALAPSFTAARADMARILYQQGRTGEALDELDVILERDPGDVPSLALKASLLVETGGFEDALAITELILERFAGEPQIWMSYGHLLKTVGRTDEAVAAYRRALALRPAQGIAWWSLANLKTVRLDSKDVAAMERTGADSRLGEVDRVHLHFALGKHYEDEGRIEPSFAHYAAGNRIRRRLVPHDPAAVTRFVERSEALFTAEALAPAGRGCPAGDPIFLVGLPRSGSTLVEQILASHPEIEGTMELQDLPRLAQRLGGGERGYHEALLAMDGSGLRSLGESYMSSTRIQRRSGRPLFVDKMPNNWLHVGLIHLILPNARIIDVRRHPLGCCFSNFAQHFERGQEFAYDLGELGLYYRDYVGLMRHYDRILPGRVHRVLHEALVEDPEAEVRRLLDHVGVKFDPACLRFHENRRAVPTASAGQVRRPINREGVERWRPFEAYLDPLKRALGPVLDCYPAAPEV
ncbi:MAG TPA: sulfotransferase [Allosphingosinicella sp.]|jgi:tetratricopeptide (TPR) repeat protein